MSSISIHRSESKVRRRSRLFCLQKPAFSISVCGRAHELPDAIDWSGVHLTFPPPLLSFPSILRFHSREAFRNGSRHSSRGATSRLGMKAVAYNIESRENSLRGVELDTLASYLHITRCCLNLIMHLLLAWVGSPWGPEILNVTLEFGLLSQNWITGIRNQRPFSSSRLFTTPTKAKDGSHLYK